MAIIAPLGGAQGEGRLLQVRVEASCPASLEPALREQAERLERVAVEEGLVGNSLEVRLDGRTCSRVDYGFADVDSGRYADDQTIYHWASNTKMLLGVAVMQLRDRGLISLDDPIVRYLPEARAIHNPHGDQEQVTLRHLLTHTSGLRSSTFPWQGNHDWAPHEPSEWPQIAGMMPYTYIEFIPGARTQYSNLGSSMLGRMIEVVTGENIEVYLTKNILMPLGMNHSYFDHTPYHLLVDRSNNYYIRNGVREAQGLDFDTGATVANGGLNAPLGDIAKWTDFLLGVNDDGNHRHVLSRASLQEMWSPRFDMPDADGEPWEMGYKFFSRAVSDGSSARIVGHAGGQKGFTSFIYVIPDAKIALIYANNSWLVSREGRHRRPLAEARSNAIELIVPLLAGSSLRAGE